MSNSVKVRCLGFAGILTSGCLLTLNANSIEGVRVWSDWSSAAIGFGESAVQIPLGVSQSEIGARIGPGREIGAGLNFEFQAWGGGAASRGEGEIAS